MVDQEALNNKVAELFVAIPNETNKDRRIHLKERKEHLMACLHIIVRMPFSKYG
jgi:hypothetical protein